MERVLVVLAAATGAALATALGALPLLARPRPPIPWLAWANALAAGMMIAAAFALAEPVQGAATAAFALGAVARITRAPPSACIDSAKSSRPESTSRFASSSAAWG